MLYRLLSFARARRLFAHFPALLALVALCISTLGLPATVTRAAIIGQVKDISPGSSDSFPDALTNVNGTLFFGAINGNSGYELWKSDGTSDGTVLVLDIFPGSGSSDPYYLTNVNGTLFFSATVSIASNASSTNPFTFAIQGTGGQQFGTSLALVLR